MTTSQDDASSSVNGTGTGEEKDTPLTQPRSPDVLGECVERFWADNIELRNRVLRDWYAGGRVTTETNMAGLRAVDKWLRTEEAA